uniref:Uncharacterized protein n=1 Tax=Buteo japonicus TaxID=224669 RepID=A0A8B9ZBY9_9AVES
DFGLSAPLGPAQEAGFVLMLCFTSHVAALISAVPAAPSQALPSAVPPRSHITPVPSLPHPTALLATSIPPLQPAGMEKAASVPAARMGCLFLAKLSYAKPGPRKTLSPGALDGGCWCPPKAHGTRMA